MSLGRAATLSAAFNRRKSSPELSNTVHATQGSIPASKVGQFFRLDVETDAHVFRQGRSQISFAPFRLIVPEKPNPTSRLKDMKRLTGEMRRVLTLDMLAIDATILTGIGAGVVENASGTINPLTGFIDVDATSSNTGTITGYDLFTNGKEFNFFGLLVKSLGLENMSFRKECRRRRNH